MLVQNPNNWSANFRINLIFYFDADLLCDVTVETVVQSCFIEKRIFSFSDMGKVSHILPLPALYSRLTHHLCVQDTAARTCAHADRTDHITPILT